MTMNGETGRRILNEFAARLAAIHIGAVTKQSGKQVTNSPGRPEGDSAGRNVAEKVRSEFQLQVESHSQFADAAGVGHLLTSLISRHH